MKLEGPYNRYQPLNLFNFDFTFISKNSSIETLKIHGFQKSRNSLDQISKMISKNQSILELDCEDLIDFSFLKQNKTIQTLRITSIQEFGDSFWYLININNTINKLILYFVRLKTRGFEKGMIENQSITELNFIGKEIIFN